MKKTLFILVTIIIAFVLYILYNTYNFKSAQLQVEPVQKIQVSEGAVDRFVEAISYRTISYQDPEDFDSTQFSLFNAFLESSYPNIHSTCEHKLFNAYSHLYKWPGQNSSLKPIVLMAHHDVVPIASPALWSVHPFDEGVKNDVIYGRGTMDDKCSLVGIVEAVEQLIKEGYEPQRTVYLAFGHDEEIGGAKGAAVIANYLEEQDVEAAMVLDEGMARVKGMIPNFDRETALIGIAEKGGVSVELTVNMVGGHSSMPGKETSIDVLSGAVNRIKQNPLKASITPVLNGFIDKLGPEMDFKAKLAFANRSIFKSAIIGSYESSRTGNALVRTTTAPTIFEAGIKENVIPTSSRAVVNFRILPGETTEDVLAHVNSHLCG